MRGFHVSRLILTAFVVLASAGAASAQTAETRFLVYGVAGGGGFGDEEGMLGGGAVAGIGGGIRIGERIQVEGLVTTARHAQIASITFEGRPTVSAGRVVYLFGDASARVRGFAGGGVGLGFYTGTRTDTSFSPPRPPQRFEQVTTLNQLGLATEAGGGVHISLGRHLFVRPEGWLVAMHTQPQAGLEPPYVMPRATVSLGVMF